MVVLLYPSPCFVVVSVHELSALLPAASLDFALPFSNVHEYFGEPVGKWVNIKIQDYVMSSLSLDDFELTLNEQFGNNKYWWKTSKKKLEVDANFMLFIIW